MQHGHHKAGILYLGNDDFISAFPGKNTPLTRLLCMAHKQRVILSFFHPLIIFTESGEFNMNFMTITSSDDMWSNVSRFAQNCSWGAGKSLSQKMSDNTFSDWERVIVALDENDIAGYCTVSKTDCIPNVPYTPYIGFLFVDEAYRGHRLSQKLISHAMTYLKSLGFPHVFLVSDHENLYEKYGFEVIDRKLSPWGEIEKIYRQEL